MANSRHGKYDIYGIWKIKCLLLHVFVDSAIMSWYLWSFRLTQLLSLNFSGLTDFALFYNLEMSGNLSDPRQVVLNFDVDAGDAILAASDAP